MESTPADVQNAIVFLCKNKGFTDKRLATRSVLVNVLGGPKTDPEMLRERFVSAINAIGGARAEVLGDSLRLTERTWEADSLLERRKIYGSLVLDRLGEFFDLSAGSGD